MCDPFLLQKAICCFELLTTMKKRTPLRIPAPNSLCSSSHKQVWTTSFVHATRFTSVGSKATSDSIAEPQRENHPATLSRHPAREKKLPKAEKAICSGNGYHGGLRAYDDMKSCEMMDSSACSKYVAILGFVLALSKLARKWKTEVYAQVPFLTLKDMNLLTRAGIKVVNRFPQEWGYVHRGQNSCVFSVHLNCGSQVEIVTLEYTRPALIAWSDGQHHHALEWEYDRVQEIDALDPLDEHDQGGSSIAFSGWSQYGFMQPVESIDDVDMADAPSGSLSAPPSDKKRSIDDDVLPETPLRKRRSLCGSVSGSPSEKKRSIGDHDHDVPDTPSRKRRSISLRTFF
ncbi:hypothetical protein DL764_000701 [Monosporascus ibericus]|uniref:Uncharacterized protein n=1 Tax=Monosporascus ibericus TaxID=155417 RepID=A0A4Q4TVV5_9PEZI|nr:hypothetical protein DL764_000701 [Monosporascus ibericus]